MSIAQDNVNKTRQSWGDDNDASPDDGVMDSQEVGGKAADDLYHQEAVATVVLDMNEFITQGVYGMEADVSLVLNIHVNMIGGGSIFVHVNGDVITQLVVDSGGKLFQRKRNAGTWETLWTQYPAATWDGTTLTFNF